MEHTIIAKEQISQCQFLPAPEDKSKYWASELAYAVRLGNEFKGKTSITFLTTEGPKTVITTVWSITDNYIHLKGGTTIPLKSLLDVHF